MKVIYILIVFTLISCVQKTKEKKEIETKIETVIKVQDVIEKSIDSSKTEASLSFDKVIENIKTKSLPLFESTNFDSFIEEGDYDDVNVKILKLEKIYPNFYQEGYNYKAIANYKLELSKSFYSVVVTILKGENEMESVLINYDLNEDIIDSKVISYDEIAEGIYKIESKIDNNILTVNNIQWIDEKQIETTSFVVDAEGKIKSDTSLNANTSLNQSRLVDIAIQQLNLDNSKVKTNLIVSKIRPNNSQETIIVIPEIEEEEEGYFELNSHIVIANNATGEIIHNYFESSKTNNWVSDAIQLREIKIDTAPYTITENQRAFGVRVYYYGMSQPNPYSNETLSLFIKSGDSLKKVLNNYDVMNYGGEWDTNCVGEFIGHKKTLSITANKTNNYFDILVNNIITETKNFEDENGDCQSKDTISEEIRLLRFNGDIYKENN